MRSVFRPRELGALVFSKKRAIRGTSLLALTLAIPGSLALIASSEAVTEKSPVRVYQDAVLPILEKHCYECHGDGYDKGKVAFDSLETDEQILKPDLWVRVLLNTRAGLMPADQKPRLSPAEQQTLERWIKYDVFQIDPANPDPGRVTVRRLNRVEYRNTGSRPARRRLQHRPRIPSRRFRLRLRQHRRRADHVAHAHGKVRGRGAGGDRRSRAHRGTPAREGVVDGLAFDGTNARTKWGKRQLVFDEPAGVSATYKNEKPGSYRVKLEFEVNGTYTPDPGRRQHRLQGGRQAGPDQDFGYFDEKVFTFDSTHKWAPGEHAFTLELKPLVPAGKKETVIDLFVRKVTIEGPLEKDHGSPPGLREVLPARVPKSRRTSVPMPRSC
jgi:hypothetical protein